MLETIINGHLLWWHWIILGIVLVIAEIFTATFFILGFGVSAIIVGGMTSLFSMSLESELMLWIVLSIISIIIWFKFLRDKTVEGSGQSNYALDTKGTVQEDIKIHERGRVKFDKPVLGNTVWYAIAKNNIGLNARVKIVEIKGQLIEVEEIQD